MEQARAVRVFRDDASLAANATLWPSIEKSLAASNYLILLLGAQSARSPSVAREVEYWLASNDREHVLLVLTEGGDLPSTFGDGDEVMTTPVRELLRHEPRYVDMRWAHGVPLDVDESRFRGAVADLAAPLHGRPKDELFGDDVRQQRRTKRIARVVIAVITALALAATGLAFISNQQRNEAREQRNEAREQRNEARRQRDTAVSRQLIAQSTAELPEHLDRSLLLAVEATHRAAMPQSFGALFTALNADPVIAGFHHGHRVTAAVGEDIIDEVALSADGSLLASTGWDGKLILWRLDTSNPEPIELASDDTLRPVLTFSLDGSVLHAVTSNGVVEDWDPSTGTLIPLLSCWAAPTKLCASATASSVATARCWPAWDTTWRGSGTWTTCRWLAASRLAVSTVRLRCILTAPCWRPSATPGPPTPATRFDFGQLVMGASSVRCHWANRRMC